MAARSSVRIFFIAYFQNGQRTQCFGSTSINSGILLEHSGFAIGQRGANRQPGGKFPMRGTLPGIAERRFASPDNCGTDAIKAFVYGCNGRCKSSFAGASSTI